MLTIESLGIVDYVVMAAVIAISVTIGIITACTGSKQRTTTEFLVGDRAMELFPVSLSVLATFTSAITVLGMPEEIYWYGVDFWWINLSIIMVIPAVAHLYLPIFYNLQITSVYEYIGLRFNNIVRLIASTTYAIQMFTYMSIVLYAPALALSHVTGLSVWTSVLTTGIVCTFYTSIGGIRAVVWTDMFQIILIFACLLSIVIQGTLLTGFDNVWSTNIEGQRLHLPDYSIDPLKRHTIWSLAFGGYFMWLYIYGINQSMVQRYVSLPSLKKAQLSVWLNLPMLFITISLTTMIGLVLYTFYHDCDPLRSGKISGRDQILPFFVMTELVKFQGLPGLFLAGLFCGALSTLSSGLNSLSAVTITDVIRPYFGGMDENVATHVTKFLVFFYGALCIGFVSIVEKLGSVLRVAATFFGIIGGPLAGIFTLGIFFPWANSKGSSIGLVLGLFFSMWIGVSEFIYQPYIDHPPLTTDGCSVNPVDMFMNNIKTDSNSLSDILKNGSSLIPTVDSNPRADVDQRSMNQSSGDMPLKIYGNITVEKIDDIDTPAKENTVLGKGATKNEKLENKPFAQRLKSNYDEQEVGRQKNKEIPVLYRISYLWFSGIGCFTTIIVGLIASCISGRQNPHDLDPRLVCDVAEVFCCCLPKFLREIMWPNVGLDYISEDAAIALLKRKSPPEIETAESDYPNDTIKGSKCRNVHFPEENDQEEMYPFDTTDIPYGVIVDQDYENFSRVSNRATSYASPNHEGSGSNTERRSIKLKNVAQMPVLGQRYKAQTLPTDVVHPRYERSNEPRYSYRVNTRAGSVGQESIQMRDLSRRNDSGRRPSKQNPMPIERSGSFGKSKHLADIGKNNGAEEQRRPSRPTNLIGIVSNRNNQNNDQSLKLQQSGDSSDGHQLERRVSQPRHPQIKDRKIPVSQKRPHKRLLSHEAEKKHRLRDRTYVKNIVMSD